MVLGVQVAWTLSTMLTAVLLLDSTSGQGTCQRQYLPIGGDCSTFNPKFCPPETQCDPTSTPHACRLSLDSRGCSGDDAKCAGTAVCREDVCVSSCEEGFVVQCGRCLMIADRRISSYNDTVRYCLDRSASQPVMTKTQDQLDCVNDFLENNGGDLLEGIPVLWIGGSRGQDGQYRWRDDDQVIGDDLWEEQSVVRDDYDCVTLNMAQGKLRKASCQSELLAMCQMDL